MKIIIIYEDDTELAEFEALNKGYRKDVIVKIDDKEFKVYITSLIRLQQDFNSEQESDGYYLSEPNTILVNEVTKSEIEKTINVLNRCNYFDRILNNGFE